ncbi:unnamed protein product [Prunus armeniaca]
MAGPEESHGGEGSVHWIEGFISPLFLYNLCLEKPIRKAGGAFPSMGRSNCVKPLEPQRVPYPGFLDGEIHQEG